MSLSSGTTGWIFIRWSRSSNRRITNRRSQSIQKHPSRFVHGHRADERRAFSRTSRKFTRLFFTQYLFEIKKIVDSFHSRYIINPFHKLPQPVLEFETVISDIKTINKKLPSLYGFFSLEYKFSFLTLPIVDLPEVFFITFVYFLVVCF